MSQCNVALLCGVVGDVVVRVLESDTHLATLSVRVPGPSGKFTSVPVVMFNPASWVETLAPDTAVVVLGSVHRRFYSLASGVTGSSTEVVASAMTRASDQRRVETLVRKASLVLGTVAA